jgi:hypothetical protein
VKAGDHVFVIRGTAIEEVIFGESISTIVRVYHAQVGHSDLTWTRVHRHNVFATDVEARAALAAKVAAQLAELERRIAKLRAFDAAKVVVRDRTKVRAR